ncbi:MAG TPA: hypothetical protein VFE47_28730 [Tepidisphaeraceae bacterium]|jgi:hypothetical protein|nr:hypothetical protein [Tepidisphaeraceae bacterium]
MILSQRERYIAIGAGALAAVSVVFGLLIHYVNNRNDVAGEISVLETQQKGIQAIFDERNRLSHEYAQMVKDGLKKSQGQAKGQIHTAIEEWVPASGISEKTLNDGQTVHAGDFDTMSFKLSGTGTMATISKLLFQCETTSLPLRISKVTLNPVTEGRDWVTFELTVTTICEAEKSSRTRAGIDGIPLRGDRL